MNKLYIIVVFLFPMSIFAQISPSCQNIFVWEFDDQNNRFSKISKILSNEVEDALSKLNCIVLQRRKFAELEKFVMNEYSIQSLNESKIEDSITSKFNSIQAERVLFGSVFRDDVHNLVLRISIENIYTKEVISSSVIFEDEFDPISRQEDIITLLSEMMIEKSNANNTINKKNAHAFFSGLYLVNIKEEYRNFMDLIKYHTSEGGVQITEKEELLLYKIKYENVDPSYFALSVGSRFSSEQVRYYEAGFKSIIALQELDKVQLKQVLNTIQVPQIYISEIDTLSERNALEIMNRIIDYFDLILDE